MHHKRKSIIINDLSIPKKILVKLIAIKVSGSSIAASVYISIEGYSEHCGYTALISVCHFCNRQAAMVQAIHESLHSNVGVITMHYECT